MSALSRPIAECSFSRLLSGSKRTWRYKVNVMVRIKFKAYSDEERRRRIARAYRRLQAVSTDAILVAGVIPIKEGEAGDEYSASSYRAGNSLWESQLATPSGAVRPQDPD